MPAGDALYAETTFHVRFAETDQMGIVHHATFFVYFEEGRSALSREHGVPYSRLEAMGYSLALVEAEARYLAPARYDERVTVRTWIEALRSRGMTYRYEVVRADDGQVLVTGHTKHVCVDRQGRVCRIPSDWLAPLTDGG